MSLHNKKHLEIKEKQKIITHGQFAEIQDKIKISNPDMARKTGLALNTIENLRLQSSRDRLCSSPVSGSILLLHYLAKEAPDVLEKIKNEL